MAVDNRVVSPVIENNPPYPWQTSQWQALEENQRQDRLHHALLLAGKPGLGKLDFAYRWAKSLLCEHKRACGHCKNCELISAGTHPDFYELLPEEPGKAIKIDQVRNLHEFIYKTSQLGGHRVALIAPAEAMNIASSNALLKSLEEPGAGTYLILVSDDPAQLLPTIKSRCQLISLSQPRPEEVSTWLQQQGVDLQQQPALLAASHHAPIRAKEFVGQGVLEKRQQAIKDWLSVILKQKGPVNTASDWFKQDAFLLVGWLQSWILDLLRIKAGQVGKIDNVDLQDELSKIVDSFSNNSLCLVSELLVRLHEDLLSSNNLNKQLLWEHFFITCQQLAVSRST